MNDGGPVFPVNPDDYPIEVHNGYQSPACWTMGMSLRDYFASQAINGMLEHAVADQRFDGLAMQAYLLADAMLKARDQ